VRARLVPGERRRAQSRNGMDNSAFSNIEPLLNELQREVMDGKKFRQRGYGYQSFRIHTL
jgi:hypothetical protein